MVVGLQNEERVKEKLKKQLAIAVRSIQWSYAIFWSISHKQPGVLEWGEGYYNGDIKTRKTLQAVELNADQMGLQRSEQLRELYESLSAGESSSPVARRPSEALSPEDLSGAEWYYLVCMSFVFNLGQGLPGRALANGQTIWLYNAHSADSKVFSRSLLAKSAFIQTVVCFPFLGGVIELGVSDLVSEDYGLIQNFKMSILDVPNPNAPKKPDRRDFGNDQDLNLSSPSRSSEELEPNQLANDSPIVEGISGAASQVQSWALMDDELSHCVHNTMDSGDCISQTLVEPETIEDLRDHNKPKVPPQDVQAEDLHYRGVIATLFKDSNQLLLGPHFQSLNWESSFIRWKRGGFRKQLPRNGVSQRLLKKILFKVPRMHGNRDTESAEENGNDEDGLWRPEANEIGSNHAATERKQRQRLSEKFSVLKTMVPSLTKDDKVLILDDAIEYLKGLERRVEELESCRQTSGSEPKTRQKQRDSSEGTSDNYGNKKTSIGEKPSVNKRKAHESEETNRSAANDSSSENIAVWVKKNDVVIDVKCSWRDGVLLEIMEALGDLHVDLHSVQSSTVDGIVSLIIKSTIKGSTAMSATAIRQALQRVTRNC